MHHVDGVCRGEARDHLLSDGQGLSDRNRPVARQPCRQRFPSIRSSSGTAVDRPAAVLEQVVHTAHVRVSDAPPELDLALEGRSRRRWESWESGPS